MVARVSRVRCSGKLCRCSFRGPVSENSVDRRDTGSGVVGTNSIRDEFLPNFPGKDGGVVSLVRLNLIDHLRSGNLRFRTSNHSRSASRRNGSQYFSDRR